MGRWLQVRRRWPELVLLLLLATAAAGPFLFSAGFLNTRGGGDSPFLLFRLHQMAAALQDGHFPVRWMPDAAYGYGYPMFNYYAALPFYLGALLHLFGFGLVAAVKLTQWLGFILAAGSMWGLARHFTRSRWAAGLAAVAYTFAPYHLVNVYVRGDSLSEFWAMGFFPLILWAAVRLWERPTRGRLLVLAFSYAALILTHNISALIFSPFLLLFIFFLIRRANWRRVSWLAASLLLGFGLSAFFWLPALAEQDAVQLVAQTSGYFHYSNHFRTLGGNGGALVQSSLLFDYDIAGRTPFSMGLVQTILAALGILLFVSRFRKPSTPALLPLALFAITTLIVSSFMILPSSEWLWEKLPLLPMVQFPWRFLSVQALATSLLVALLVASLPRLPGPRYLLSFLLTALLFVSAMLGLKPDFVSLSTADITPETLQLYEWFSGNVGTTIRYEYLPRAVQPRLYTSEAIIYQRPMEAMLLAGEATAELLVKHTGRESWRVTVATETATVSFSTLYWPGWRAELDGEKVPVRPAKSLGTLTLDLPAGEHTVELRLGRTPVRWVGELAFLFAALVCLMLVQPWRGVTRKGLIGKRILTHCLLPVALFALVLHLRPAESPAQDDLTWDFDQQAFLHHNPDGVRFGDAAVMQSYQLDEGQWPLEVTLNWKAVDRSDLVVELALVHPAEVVERVDYTVVAETQSLRVGTTSFALPAPENAPPGPLLPRVRVLDAVGNPLPALTSLGNTRGELYLRVAWNRPTQFWEGESIQLISVEAQHLSADSLGVTLHWGVGEPLPANYKIALRLYDSAGRPLAELDTQPGYGFYPTSLWPAGSSFVERYELEVPAGLPPEDYQLTVSLYDAASLQPRWGPVQQPFHLCTVAPYDDRPIVHQFTNSLAVTGLIVPSPVELGERFDLTVDWVVLDTLDSLSGHWQLVAADGDVAVEGVLALGDWPAGSLVSSRYPVALPSDLESGEYTLQLLVSNGKPWDAAGITVQPSTRQFELPQMQAAVGVEYGDLIRLEGYDLTQGQDSVDLTLFWRALDRLSADYTVFVHLFDPVTGQIPSQYDGMPRGFTYPTSQWVSGEVVDDPIKLSLDGVPAGDYRLAVGWYRAVGDQYPRLPAVDSDGVALPDDRAILPAEIRVP